MKSNFQKVTTFLLLIISHQFIQAQPDTLWTKLIGGESQDEIYSLDLKHLFKNSM